MVIVDDMDALAIVAHRGPEDGSRRGCTPQKRLDAVIVRGGTRRTLPDQLRRRAVKDTLESGTRRSALTGAHDS